MVERSMRNPEEIKTAVGRRLAHLSDSQAQFTGEDENSLLHGKGITFDWVNRFVRIWQFHVIKI